MGHAADRIGWRCFDPITFKFIIRYELIFDEHSAKKCICALREFDRRRTLARQGKLDELPQEADDLTLPMLQPPRLSAPNADCIPTLFLLLIL